MAGPLRRVYFGLLFLLDLIVTVTLYLLLAAFESDDDWAAWWEEESAGYALNESLFDVLLLSITRTALLFFIYSVAPNVETSLPVTVLCVLSIAFLTVKCVFYDSWGVFSGLLIGACFSLTVLQLVIVGSRVRHEKRSRRVNPFFDATSSINSAFPNYYEWSRGQSLIPTPFSGPIATYNDEVPNSMAKKRDWVSHTGESILRELLKQSGDLQAWRFFIEAEDMIVYRRTSDESRSVVSIKATTLIPAPPQDVHRVVSNVARRPEWDPLCTAGKEVEDLGGNAFVAHVFLPGLGPLLQRDLCFLSVSRRQLDGTYLVACRSVVHYDRPELLNTVRGDLQLGGFVIRPKKADPNTSLVTFVQTVDLRGWLPARVKDVVLRRQPVALAALRCCIENGSFAQNVSVRPPVLNTLSKSLGRIFAETADGSPSVSTLTMNTSGFTSGSLVADMPELEAYEADYIRNNLIPRVAHRLELDGFVSDYETLLAVFRETIETAKDLRLEDRQAEADLLVQRLVVSIAQHRQYALSHLGDEGFWQRECTLARMAAEIDGDTEITLLRHEAVEARGWLPEFQQVGEWTPLRTPHPFGMWLRSDGTYRCNVALDTPLVDLLAVILEADLVRGWVPRSGPWGVLASKELARMSRLSRVSYGRVKMPWPFLDREVIIEFRGFDVLCDGHLLILMRSVESFDDIEIPQPTNNVRVGLEFGGILLYPLTKSQTEVTMLVNFDDMGFTGLPAFVREWVVKHIVGNIFGAVVNKQVVGTDHEQVMSEQGDVYAFIQRRVDQYFAHQQPPAEPIDVGEQSPVHAPSSIVQSLPTVDDLLHHDDDMGPEDDEEDNDDIERQLLQGLRDELSPR